MGRRANDRDVREAKGSPTCAAIVRQDGLSSIGGPSDRVGETCDRLAAGRPSAVVMRKGRRSSRADRAGAACPPLLRGGAVQLAHRLLACPPKIRHHFRPTASAAANASPSAQKRSKSIRTNSAPLCALNVKTLPLGSKALAVNRRGGSKPRGVAIFRSRTDRAHPGPAPIPIDLMPGLGSFVFLAFL